MTGVYPVIAVWVTLNQSSERLELKQCFQMLVHMNSRLIELGFCKGDSCRQPGRHRVWPDVTQSEGLRPEKSMMRKFVNAVFEYGKNRFYCAYDKLWRRVSWQLLRTFHSLTSRVSVLCRSAFEDPLRNLYNYDKEIGQRFQFDMDQLDRACISFSAFMINILCIL